MTTGRLGGLCRCCEAVPAARLLMPALSALGPRRQCIWICTVAPALRCCSPRLPSPLAALGLFDVQCVDIVCCGGATQAGDLSKHSETRIKEIEQEIKSLDKELVSCFWLLLVLSMSICPDQDALGPQRGLQSIFALNSFLLEVPVAVV